jgi:hypothetical protein
MRRSLATDAMSVIAGGLVDAGTPQGAIEHCDQLTSGEDIPAPVANDFLGKVGRADHAGTFLGLRAGSMGVSSSCGGFFGTGRRERRSITRFPQSCLAAGAKMSS